MAQKKKKEIEFRYYELPKGEPAICLYGESWIREYGLDAVMLHFHNLFEIGICIEGEGTMQFDEEVVAYKPGFFTLIPQNYPHTTTSAAGTKSYWEYIFFNPMDILQNAYPDDKLFAEKLLEKVNQNAGHFDSIQKKEISELIQMILKESKQKEFYASEVIRSLLLTLLLRIVRDQSENKIEKNEVTISSFEQIEKALEYIENHYMETILVQDLARNCLLSETHFRRVFTDYMNMTPAEYISLIRIKKSCELLNKTNYSMDTVARKVGYDVVSSFNRNFRKIVGTTPYQYKINRKNYAGKWLNFKVSTKKGW